jgi:LPXTG-site transpeptidase (sortase) family protein
MFSKIDQLNKNDSIFISDLNTNRLEYIIYDKYITNENNFTCTNNTKDIEITLVTCNKNNNRKRIIIKAKMKES